MNNLSLFFVFLLFISPHINANDYKSFSLSQLQETYQDTAPTIVGFDIDDTVLFSTPCWHAFEVRKHRGGLRNVHDSDFWDYVNGECLDFSLPKMALYPLLQFHQNRGDTIYFVTGRQKHGVDQTGEYLAESFDLNSKPKVYYSNEGVKSHILKRLAIKVFYGDSDEDILAALDVRAKPIRILRAQNSNRFDDYNPGFKSEIVLENSGY